MQAPNYEPSKPIKGVLPVSRNIFGKHRDYRSTAAYKAQVTPEPKARPDPHGPEAERIAYKREMSFVRRQTLREGISEIWARKEERNEDLGRKSGLKRMRNERAARAAAPLDEVLTTPSMHPSVRLALATGNAPGPKPVRSSQYPAMQAAKSAARKEALHNLYVNAQHFIVNEQQLNEEIDRVFGSDEMPVRWNQTNGIWGLQEKPRTAGEMMAQTRSGKNSDVDTQGNERMRRIAETLTGGKNSDLFAEKKW